MARRDRRTPHFSVDEAVHQHGLGLAVAGHGLPSRRTDFPTAPLDDQQWSALLSTVRDQWIWGLLATAVAEGTLPCTDRQREEAHARVAQAAMADLMVEARLAQTSDLLCSAGIEHRVLKGVTTAARVYPQRSLRSYGDVDVLVTGASFDASVRLLTRNGGRRRYPEARAGFDRRFSKGTSFWMPDGISVDLHRTFVLGPYGFTIDLAGIFSRSDVVMVAGRAIPCLEIVDAAVHACLHAALGDWPPRLVPIRDVVQFVTDERVDPVALLERAGEWRCWAVAARALMLAQAAYELPDGTLARWSAGYVPKRWERRALRLYGEGHTYRRQAIAAVRYVPGGRRKLAYIRALALPAPTYLRQREDSLVGRDLGSSASRSGEARSDDLRRTLRSGTRRLLRPSFIRDRARCRQLPGWRFRP